MATARPRLRWRKWILALAAGIILLPPLEVAIVRYANPPATPLMGLRWMGDRISGREQPRLLYSWRSWNELPVPFLKSAWISEDERFFRHHGFDWIEMQKVLEDDMKRHKLGRGGSTITQQLVKNLFLTTERSFVRKGAEFALVPLVEAFLTKDRILELYLNVIEWGPGIYGAEAASEHYYHAHASEMTREQAARLAAIIPAPLKRKPERMNEYSAEILFRMEQTGW